MNRKQRRIQESAQTQAATLRLRGRDYTVEDADALAQVALQRGDVADALVIYNVLATKLPRQPEVYNARGLTLHRLKRYAEAIADYDRAILLRPAYAEAFNNRAMTSHELRRYGDALTDYDRALEHLPGQVEIHLNRLMSLHQLGRHDELLASAAKALEWSPGSARLHLYIGNSLQATGRYAEALASYDRAIALDLSDAEAHNNKGVALQELKKYGDAVASYEKAVTLRPGYAAAFHNQGLVHVNLGRIDEAHALFENALALDPAFAPSLFGLAQLQRYRDPSHAHVARIRSLLQQPEETSLRDRQLLHFTLGKIYDDCAEYDEAFAQYERGNRLRNANLAYDPVVVEKAADSIRAQHFNGGPAVAELNGTVPIFIVGMPRSGTTLLAAILSNHPAIASAGEVGLLPEPIAAHARTPAVATDFARRLLGTQAAASTYVIDKHPLNFFQLGLIASLFHRPVIIHCARHPADTMLSNYFQMFSRQYAYASDPAHIAHFYNEYEKLMRHWQSVLPLTIIEATYEEMVLNTEAMARRILASIGLSWHPACLSPHTNPYAVETASNWQVRQPVYAHALGRWRSYEKYLDKFTVV